MHARSTAWEHARRRWLRPDFERYLKPDWRDRKYWVTPPPEWAQHPDDVHFPPAVTTHPAAAGAGSPDSMRGEIAEIERNIQLLRRELASIQYELLQRKAGFKEDQPRWPKGSPDSVGGRWSGDGPAKPGIGHNQGPPLDDPPEIPKQRPQTGKERNGVVKALAKWAARARGVLGPAGIATVVADLVADRP